MYWLEVSVTTDGEAAEAVAEALRPFAYQDGVVLEQLGDATSLQEDALEPTVTVKIFVPEMDDTPALRQRIAEILYHLNRLYPVPQPVFREMQDRDWANAWKEHYHPLRIGRHLWLQPSWVETAVTESGDDQATAADIILILDPGMAFGTGTHPTTQLCLQALEEIVQPGMKCLDVGTGSGILAIAAVKLGATSVTAVDIDAIAVETAVANAQQNQTQAHIQTWQGGLTSVPLDQWEVVVANILAPVIIDMLDNDGLLRYVAPNGYLILSGIIDRQAEDVATAVRRAGGDIWQTHTIRDWVCLIARPHI